MLAHYYPFYMNTQPIVIDGGFLVTPPVFGDDRGSFTFRPTDSTYIQENISVSARGVFRGVHLQVGENSQQKNVRVLSGKALDLIIDLRKDSPTFKQTYTQLLDAESKVEMTVPAGCGHAFIALEDDTIFQYLVDKPYDPDNDVSIRYETIPEFVDALSAYEFDEIVLSDKDKAGISLEEFLAR